MGLAQKRIIQDYQQNEFPKWKEQFNAVAGFDVPMDIKWDTMQDEGYSDKAMYFECYQQVYFRPLMNVMKHLCQDDMGKEAVKASLKKIVIDGTDGSGPHNSSFDNGVFLIKHKFHTNTDYENDRVKGWTKLLEDKL